MSTADWVHLRLFAEASAARSAELAVDLVRSFAEHGIAHVRESGTYWKIPEYLEFNVDLTPVSGVSACVSRLRSLEPTGWSGNVWNHRPGGQLFLIVELRWAWLTTADD